MELLLPLLLILSAPVGVIILFAMHAGLRQRIARLEREIEHLRAELWRSGAPVFDAPAAEPPPVPLAQEAPPPASEPFAEPGPEWGEEPEEPAEREGFGGVFERFVAGRLLIWTGGAALIGAAFFLIRHSIEIGLLTPQARMVAAAVFGLALVVVGEYARFIRWLSDDPRVAQALVGAGIVVLYATPYGSHVLYGLIDARMASLVMLLVSAAALVLSLRHGAATALMGLIGGFLTPALVGDPSASAVPLLVYLTIVNGAVFGIAWRRGWTWLAALAVAFSFLWSFYLLGRPPDDAVATGFFIIALAVAAVLLRPGGGREIAWVQPLAIGLAQLAILVGRTDLGPAAWILFGALAAATLLLALLRPDQRFAPAAALGLALLLIMVRAEVQDPHVVPAALLTTLAFAAFAVPMALRRDRLLHSVIACGALAGPVLLLRLARPELLERPLWGALMLALAVAALLAAWLQRGEAGKEQPADRALFLLAAAAALLLGGGAYDLLPPHSVAAAWVAAAIALAGFGGRLGERGFALVAVGAALIAVVRAADMVPGLWSTAGLSLLGDPAFASRLPPPGVALLELALTGALLAALAPLVREAGTGARRRLTGIAILFGLAALYVLAKQVFAIDDRDDFADWGFAERTAINQGLFLIGWLLASRRLPARWLGNAQAAWLGSAVTLVAAARLIWFDHFLHNPAVDPQWVGPWPLLNLLLPAYLLSALWLYAARRRADAQTRSGLWFALFMAALVTGVSLMVRQLYHGAWLAAPGVTLGESYSYSLAGLLLAAALILGGIRLPDKAVRLAGLVLLTLVVLKVFLVDASALEGVLRILSFFGLGVGLIGVALLYGPVLRAEAKGRRREAEEEMVGATGFEPATPTPPV